MIRRTSLSSRLQPSPEAVAAAARIAAADLGWSPAREASEIDDALRRPLPFGSTVEPGG